MTTHTMFCLGCGVLRTTERPFDHPENSLDCALPGYCEHPDCQQAQQTFADKWLPVIAQAEAERWTRRGYSLYRGY